MLSTISRPNSVFGWSPSVRGELDRAFRNAFGNDAHVNGTYFSAPVSVWETEEHIYAELDLPGFTIEDLDITLENGLLKIAGDRRMAEGRGDLHVNERRFGHFERIFRLSDVIDHESVDAEYHNGVLCLTLKKRAEAKPMRIEIKDTSG